MKTRSKVQVVDLWPYVLQRNRSLQSGKLVTHISSVPTESQLISTTRFSHFKAALARVVADVCARGITMWITLTGRAR